MPDDDPIDQASKSISAIGKIIDIAGESDDAKEAGKGLARLAKNAVHTVEVALLPLAAVSFGYTKAKDYFENKFPDDLGEKIKDIPDEDIIEPSPSVVAPALQGLGFSSDEPSLKEMYLKLIASAMDGRAAKKAHPAFAEIIKQLTAEEATILDAGLGKMHEFPVVTLQLTSTSYVGFKAVARNVPSVEYNHLPIKGFARMADNWERLGLFEIRYDQNLLADGSYSWVPYHPIYRRLQENLKPEESITIAEGVMGVTDFGRAFFKTVL